MEDFERIVEDLHKDANLKFAHEYEVKKKSNIDIYIYIYPTVTSARSRNNVGHLF